LGVNHYDVIWYSIITKLKIQTNKITHTTASMQVEMNVAAFFQARVWVEDITIFLHAGCFEPPSIDKFVLLELSVHSF
jgi:hypothetical protein